MISTSKKVKKSSIVDSKKSFFLIGMIWFWGFLFLFILIFSKLFTELKLNILWAFLTTLSVILTNLFFSFIYKSEKKFKSILLFLADLNVNFGSLLCVNLCINEPHINTFFWLGGLCIYYGSMLGSFSPLRLFFSQFFYVFFYVINYYFLIGNKFGWSDYLYFSMGFFFLIFTNPISIIVKKLKSNFNINRKILEKKRMENRSLLENLGQGFMVIDKNGFIQDGATEITKGFFQEDLVGKKFHNIINLEGENLDIYERWLINVWKGHLSFKDLKGFGPKFYKNNDGSYIDLEYRPIYVKDSKREIDKIICVATDKTKEIRLENQLELDKQKAIFTKNCLQNPSEFLELLDETYELLEAYPTIKEMDIDEIFRKFHTLKARFGQYGIKKITNIINKIETTISKKDLKKIDIFINKFRVILNNFVKENKLIIEAASKFLADEGNAIQASLMLEKLNSSNNSVEELKEFIYQEYILVSLKEKFKRYESLVKEVAEKQGKFVNFEITGDEIKVNTNRYSNFINTSIHIFRNMVDHGIETVEERIEKGKSRNGNVKFALERVKETIFISIKDDGRGINPDIIRSKLIEKKIQSSDEVKSLNDEEIIKMVFSPGFSTKDEVTTVSGRGIGLDAVKEEVERLGGKISLISKINQGTTFFIELPILN